MNIQKCLDILELESVASPEELKRAYRALVQIWHPDRFHGNLKLEKQAGEKLREITSAYNYLLNYFDPNQSKRLRTSASEFEGDAKRYEGNYRAGVQNRSRPRNFFSAGKDISGRHASPSAGLRASAPRKTSSGSKYIFLLMLFIVLGAAGFIIHHLSSLDDIITTSVGPASEILQKIEIDEVVNESVGKEGTSLQNIIGDQKNEITPAKQNNYYEIYLDSGNVIITDSWWKEDDMIIYKKHGGTMGIESARVKEIIKR